MKTMKKIFALALALCMSMGMVSAATTYTPVNGTSCNFNKYLIMDEGDSVPNATFSFTVAPGTAIAADPGTTMAVLAGVGSPTIADVTFAPGDATATAAGSNIDVARTNVDRGGAAGDAVQLDAGEKYATKQATVDFSSVQFTEPGIYRYIITETANAAHASAGIIHDTDADRVLDVYVTDDGTGALVVSQYVLHTEVGPVDATANYGSGDVATAGTAIDDKTDGFTNEYASKDLKFSKEVSGNQASRDKYFEFTVTVSGIADEDSYVVSIADDNNAVTNDGNADATSGSNAATIAANAGKTNPTTVTGAQLKAGQKFYLQHGQSIVIRGLAPNATYTVTENAEDYKSEVMAGKTNTGVIGTVAGENKMAEAGFRNVRDGVVPTGIAMSASTGLILVAGSLGWFVLGAKRRKEEE